jgi:hypothetical protein
VVTISTINRKTPSGDDFKDRLVFFEVERSYRGWEARAAEVVTGWGGDDCGYDFREGMRYLVHAYPHQETGKLYTGICQRTRPLSEAAEDMEYLNTKDEPSHGAGIEGRIEELDSKKRIEVVGFLEGMPVLISGPSGRQTIVSQKDGRFQLWGLSPGSYRVPPVLPKSFLPAEQTAKLGRNSCVELRFLATPRPRGSRRGDIRHKAFEGRLAKVEVDRTLYERRKDEDCFLAVYVTKSKSQNSAVSANRGGDDWNPLHQADPSGVRLYSTFGTTLACALRSAKPHFASAFSSRPNTLSATGVVPAALTARFNSPYRRGLSLSSQAILSLCLPFVSL